MSSTMLELAISMILLYLALSAACSAIQEIISNALRWRAKTLERGIAGLLQDEKFKEDLYKLPLFQGLYSPNVRGQLAHKPSYIAPSTFALAVLDLATRNGMSLPGTPNAAIPANPVTNSRTELLLQSILVGAKDVEDQKKRLEDWFNSSMDRISGWYKRKAHAVLWIIGIIICIGLNADSITLANLFWHDQALRSAIVDAASQYVKDAKGNNPDSQTGVEEGPKSPQSTDESKPDSSFDRLTKVRTELAKTNIPLGWCVTSRVNGEWELSCWPNLDPSNSNTSKIRYQSIPPDPRILPPLGLAWLWKLLGIVITTLAISQGAPFWFDLLQKAVNLRLSGNTPDEKQTQSES